MAKNRFDKLSELEKFENSEFVKNAEMTNNKSEEKKGHIHIYSVPSHWIETLKKNGYNISRFCKMAIESKMKEEGLLN